MSIYESYSVPDTFLCLDLAGHDLSAKLVDHPKVIKLDHETSRTGPLMKMAIPTPPVPGRRRSRRNWWELCTGNALVDKMIEPDYFTEIQAAITMRLMVLAMFYVQGKRSVPQ